MRWAFIGIGRVTPRMVEAVRHSSEHQIYGVAARDEKKLEHWCEQFKVTERTTDLFRWCSSPEIDAIYIALPPSLHCDFVTAALRSNKVVLCEKPLTVSRTEIAQIRSELDRSKGKLLHASAFPFHSRCQAIRDLIRRGEIGDVRRVSIACSFSHVLQRGPDYRTDPKLGGGALLDLGWYCALATLWFTGFNVESIQSYGDVLESQKVSSDPQTILPLTLNEYPNRCWLHAQAIAKLSNGAIAHWDCGYDAPGRKWIEIAGTRGSIICDDFLRPWDPEKPRFWVHGDGGKVRAEIVGESEFQESALIDACSQMNRTQADEFIELGFKTQSILFDWQDSLNGTRHS